MIYLITNKKEYYTEDDELQFAKGKDFLSWLKKMEDEDRPITLDTETNIVEGVYGWKGHLKGKNKNFEVDLDENGNKIPEKRECYLVQIGDDQGVDQWMFDVPRLNSMQHSSMLEGFRYQKGIIIHNALFDATVVKWCFNIEMTKILDTYLMSLIVHTGLEVGEDLPKGYHSLAGCASRILNIEISKEEQTGFNGEPLTIAQIKYAASDVAILGPIYRHLLEEVKFWKLDNVVTLESALIKSYSDSMIENLYLNPVPWRENMKKQEENLIVVRSEFYELMKEHFYEDCKKLDFIQAEDEFLFNWRSSTIKKAILRYSYPDMPEDCTTIKDYKDYYKSVEEREDVNLNVLSWLLNSNYERIEEYFISNPERLEFLKEAGIFVPKDTIKINLNSPVQKLKLFQLIRPELESSDKEAIGKIHHPLAFKLLEYNKASKLATSYGQNFLESIDPDGMFRVKSYSQILSTGRSSMSQLQLLP